MEWKAGDILKQLHRRHQAPNYYRQTPSASPCPGCKGAAVCAYLKTLCAERDVLIEKTRLDPLTQIYNQSGIQQLVQRYLREKATEESYALFILDLDYFKQINDTMGHLFGNAILVQVAAAIKRICRKMDLIGRVGGDEFLILLKGMEQQHALEKASEIAKTIQGLHRSLPEDMKIDCCIGITVSRDGQTDFLTLFSQADQALYRAKKQGRSGYILYGRQEEDADKGAADDEQLRNIS